jgi:DNA-binding response OmpR family regulator
MASEALRGKLLETKSENENVSAYLTENNGKKALMVINKMPKTKAVIDLNIPGFTGKATLKQLRSDNMKNGYSSETIDVTEGGKITLPAWSVTTITIQ